MIRASITCFGLTVGALPLLAALPAAGQDEDGAFDRTPQSCVVVSRIDETEALDDQNLIFRMKGNRVYRNHLPRKCPGLERENRFSYQTTAGRLCSTDTITVLEDHVGGVGTIGGLRAGFTCRLGEFVPLSPAEIEDLELTEKGAAGQRAVETRSVEIEREDESENEDERESESAGRDD